MAKQNSTRSTGFPPSFKSLTTRYSNPYGTSYVELSLRISSSDFVPGDTVVRQDLDMRASKGRRKSLLYRNSHYFLYLKTTISNLEELLMHWKHAYPLTSAQL